MTYTIDLRSGAVTEMLDSIALAMENPQAIHEAMAAGVEAAVGEHLRGLNSRSPHTDFYASAARGIETEADGSRALVRIPKLGLALRLYGGTVTPGKGISSYTGLLTRALAIPGDNVPIVGPPDGRYRQRPAEAGLLAFIPARGRDTTVGYLIEGEERTVTRGKRKGQKRIVPTAGGKFMYTLVSEVTHDPDPSVLPSDEEITTAAVSAAMDYVESIHDEGGAS